MNIIREFTGETPLHGPAFAFGPGRSKRHVICFLPLLLFCIVMAVYQTAMLIQLYQTVPTAINIAWTKEDPLKLDNLIFSIPHMLLDAQTTSSTNVANVADLTNELSQVDAKKLHSDINAGIKPILSNVLVVNMMRMFAKLSAAEKMGSKVAANVGNVHITPNFNLQYDFTFAWEHKDTQIHDFLVNNNISFIPLLQTVMASICDRMKVRIRNETLVDYAVLSEQVVDAYISRRIGDDYDMELPDVISCQPDMIVYFDESIVSLQLSSPANPIVFKSAGDVYQVRFLSCTTGYGLGSLKSVTPVYAHLDNKVYFDKKLRDRSNQIGMRHMFRSSNLIRIRTAFQFYNTKRSPCTESPNQYDCLQTCLGNRFAANCHCWPLTRFRWKPTGSLICGETLTAVTPPNNNATPYFDCPLLTENDTKFCSDKCLRNCARIDYESESVDNKEETNFFQDNDGMCSVVNCDASQPYTSIQLKVEMFSYQLIQEIPLKDWQSFLNELGGLVGVWLGGSLIAFVHIPLFLLDYCKSAYDAKKVKVGDKTKKCSPEKKPVQLVAGMDQSIRPV